MHYIISGIGSRIDPSESHATPENSKNLLYKYPNYDDLRWWRRTFRTYLLGQGYGGFVRLAVGTNQTDVYFYSNKGSKLNYQTSIPPRKKD